jgi:hypothetical protein
VSQAHANYPHIRVLLTTGYADAASAADSALPILRKPYRLPALAQAVREALDGGPVPGG